MITIVSGAQWGSEAKGAVCGFLATHGIDSRPATHMVRTGAINAGHTVYYQGQPYAMQQLPVGWVMGGYCQLVLGAGAYIHPPTLAREIEMVEKAAGRTPTVMVDHRAGLHLDFHTDRSTDSGRHHAIGATGKGSSEAIVDRIRRRGEGLNHVTPRLFRDWLDSPEAATAQYSSLPGALVIQDTALVLNKAADDGAHIVLEGTQGTLLDLYHGPYPFTTHKPTLPAQWMVEAGLSPSIRCPINTALVVRTFPIRVAGNSGPMPRETSWPEVARTINRKLWAHDRNQLVQESVIREFEAACTEVYRSGRFPIPDPTQVMFANDGMEVTNDGLDIHQWTPMLRNEFQAVVSELHKVALEQLSEASRLDLRRLFEFTTVTKKLRRVAFADPLTLGESFTLNRPTHVFVNFMNYVLPHMWGQEEAASRQDYMLMGDFISRNIWPKFPAGGDFMRWYYSTGPTSSHVHQLR